MTPKTKLTRRKLLCGTAAAGVLAPFVPILESEAQAQPIQRLVTWFTPMGTIQSEWTPDGTEQDFQFRRILKPLEALKQNVIVVAGLKHVQDNPGTSHKRGAALAYSGSRINDDSLSTGISIDQQYAKQIGSETRFRSLHVSATGKGFSVTSGHLAYTGPLMPIVSEPDPTKVFDKVFSTPAEEPAQLEQLRQQKRSVLDLVDRQLTRLKPKYSAADQAKLDAHLTAVRAIERRLSLSALDCGTGDNYEQIPIKNDQLPENGKRMMDILVAALSCDVTRIATIKWATSDQRYTWLTDKDGNPIDTRGHHTLSHDARTREQEVLDAPADEALQAINVWRSEQLAYFMNRLAEFDALDNTLIVNDSDIAVGTHQENNMPILLAGGVGGKLKMGRFLQYNPNPGALVGEDVPHANNQLLVSILNYLGQEDVQAFGTEDQGMGPLPGL